MRIGGLQKLTLLDYPGKVACTVFLAGYSLGLAPVEERGQCDRIGVDGIAGEVGTQQRFNQSV